MGNMPKARVLDEYKDSYAAEIEAYFEERKDCIVTGFNKFEAPIAYVKPGGAPSMTKWAASKHLSENTVNEWREQHPAFNAAYDRGKTHEHAILEALGEAGLCPRYVEMRFKELGLLKDAPQQRALPAVNVNIDLNSLKYADVKDIDEGKIVAMIEDVQKQEAEHENTE
jgi:hypothetical protein